MTIQEALNKTISELNEYGIQEPILKARILLAFVINKDKEYLIVNEDEELSNEEKAAFKQAAARLLKGEPLQHIIGVQEFMKLKFMVNKNVLIPRPDTEILVEEVIHILQKTVGVVHCATRLQILDLCTGSGAIAVSIAKYAENVNILGTDISQEALDVAKQNAEKNNVKIEFIESDLFENIKGKFDVIISNPPYIEKEEMKKLDAEVQKEPVIALDGGEDGLDFYRRIISEALKYLNPEGYLCLEIGYNQKETVMQLIKESNHYKDIYSKKDLAGIDRVIICKLK
ncbi:MAG: peptide chain release factor N(5)-glutamine methyltransferase [Firmicutes bacterium]|nr:peptide chain release factor N(5)-glutamine methyltransferase [Bacillota bacterium]